MKGNKVTIFYCSLENKSGNMKDSTKYVILKIYSQLRDVLLNMVEPVRDSAEYTANNFAE